VLDFHRASCPGAVDRDELRILRQRLYHAAGVSLAIVGLEFFGIRSRCLLIGPGEETNDPIYADERNFFKVERWNRNDLHIEEMLHAGSSIERLTGSPCSGRVGTILSGSGRTCLQSGHRNAAGRIAANMMAGC
jgi:hypothetical protein